MRWILITTFCSYLGLYPVAASGQSRYAPIFEEFEQTGDRAAFLQKILEANRQEIDFRLEVPALLNVLSPSHNLQAQEQARGWLCDIAFNHPLAYSDPNEREVFRPVVPVFERHLDEAFKDENSPWGPSIVALTAYTGFPPSPQALALMYRMVDYADSRNQGLALLALARLNPLPPGAKKVLFSRLRRRRIRCQDLQLWKRLHTQLRRDRPHCSTIPTLCRSS